MLSDATPSDSQPGWDVMKAQDFRGFIEQLGDLTEVQRSALAAALAGKGSGNEAIALIEMQFSTAPACGNCKSERFGSWGHASGLKGVDDFSRRRNEHAKANAIDISGFTTSTGATITVGQSWGPTLRGLLATPMPALAAQSG